MAVKLFKSTDASAPVLTGQVGTLVALLDAVLVNGYGATLAAGWTIAYTAVNKRQYAMAAGGTGCQLFVDDSAPGAGLAREARFNGFKTGTAIGAGTGQFPTTGQMTAPVGALVIRKSATADAVARAWTIIADGKTVYLFIDAGDTTVGALTWGTMFGDFFSYSSTDTNNCMIIGRRQENVNQYGSTYSGLNWSTNTAVCETFNQLNGPSTTGMADICLGHFVAGNFTGVGGALPVGKHSDMMKMGHRDGTPQMGYAGQGPAAGNTTVVWPNQLNYPNGPDGGLHVAPIWVHHNGFVRGYLKGLWCPLQDRPLGHLDTYAGTGNLAGKSMVSITLWGVLNQNMNQSSLPYVVPTQVHVEYSDTWS